MAPPKAYCPTCNVDRTVVETAPWQADLCDVCGSELAEEPDTAEIVTRCIANVSAGV